MTTKEKLKSICNYVEKKNLQQSQLQISIVQTISSDDEEYIREQKEKNRDLAIDITLGNKEESEWEKREQWGESSYSGNIISPRVTTLSINISPFKDHDSVYKDVIDFLEKKTSTPISSKMINQSNLNYTISNDSNLTNEENYEANIRRIITKVIACSNLIAVDGRIGPGKSVIIGENNWVYFKYIESKYGGISNMSLIYDNNIDSNKIIVARDNSSNHPGILVVENEIGGKYDFFIKETPNWSKQYCWFWIN